VREAWESGVPVGHHDFDLYFFGKRLRMRTV
jgi:hypothetical protein